ncbi:MAG: hypothetical protein GXY87_02800 [Tissierellia bacterium]|nr:hypothetical protein [Tissierellia bacterium]
MDFYKKKILANILLGVLFIVGLVLQFVGHEIDSYTGLAIQFVSLAILIAVLFIYNRRHK